MAENNGMLISFADDYTEEEKYLIQEAFDMVTTTIERKDFGQVLDTLLASPGMVVVTFVSGAIATGLFRKLGGDIYDAVKKKLSEGFAKKVKAKVRFVIFLGNVELNVEFDIKNMEQLDFVCKNILELIQKYETDGLAHEFQAIKYRVTDDNNWERVQPGKSGQASSASSEMESKGGLDSQDFQNLYVFSPEEDSSEYEYKVFRQQAILDNPYHIEIFGIDNQVEFKKLLELRESVYIKELGWIEAEDSFYDNEHAVYIVVYDEENNHVGSLRILKPGSPWMIETEEAFKELLDGYQINKTPASIEITRLLITKAERHKLGSLQASVRLFQALYHWMKAANFDTIYMIVRPEYMRFFRIECFCPVPMGKRVEGFDGVAGKIDLKVTMPYMREHNYDLWAWILKNQ